MERNYYIRRAGDRWREADGDKEERQRDEDNWIKIERKVETQTSGKTDKETDSWIRA